MWEVFLFATREAASSATPSSATVRDDNRAVVAAVVRARAAVATPT